ncbi:hypothetical protein L5G28_07765 [Gordonia sp. HY285]|uniref:hypothetical protein n=1 Tax=Gordonia liuliyuniae TaxID=2911517 RepID=UPI001F42F664|nr:hypothetical protein [Gordonia liuliyuniae]MCF8610058.1 hypothetical protein [Gordonia liuliyuniae]
MAVVAPPLLVPTPTLTPPRFGLLSVAEIVDDPDLHWQNGTEHLPNPTPSGSTSGVDCDPDPLTPTADTMDTVVDGSLRVWANFTLPHAAFSADEVHERARLALSVSESNSVESAIWSSSTSPLMSDDTVTPAGTSAVPMLAGLGALERWLWDNYGGTGVLHVPRQLVPFLVADRQVAEKNGRLVTPLGTAVSAGAYPATGPAGAAAPAGQAWIVASGTVRVRRSPVRVPGANGSAYFDYSTNTALGHAERVYVVGWEGVQAAALVGLAGEGTPIDPNTGFPGVQSYPGLNVYPEQGA